MITVGGKQAMALIDSGSNSTFMNLQFALQTSCTIVKDKTRAVTVAGGGKLWSGSYIPLTTFTAGNTQFQQQFRILDLPGHDVVLGSDWMAQHSPVSFSYDPRQLTVNYNGQTPITIPACETLSATDEIDALELNRLLLSGAPAFVLQLAEDTTLQSSKQHTTPPEIQEILTACSEVFQEPTGLPPVRDLDHEIPLKPDAAPPNSRPYRVPHMQRNEMEKQIHHLLQSK